jgi:hypothetical protein
MDGPGGGWLGSPAALARLRSGDGPLEPLRAAAPISGAGFTAVTFGVVCVIVGLILLIGVAEGERGCLRRAFQLIGIAVTLLGLIALGYGALLLAGVMR